MLNSICANCLCRICNKLFCPYKKHNCITCKYEKFKYECDFFYNKERHIYVKSKSDRGQFKLSKHDIRLLRDICNNILDKEKD